MTLEEKGNQKRILVRFDNGFYDLSSYLDSHPGGVEVLERVDGEDITERLLQQEAHKRVLNFIKNKLKSMQISKPVDVCFEKSERRQI